MIRVYIPQEIVGTVQLDKEQGHYVTKVMRLKAGDRMRIFNPSNGDWVVEIAQLKPHVQVKVIEPVTGLHNCPPLHLFFAPVKQDGTNFIIQKGTELGVTDFHPVLTERSNTRRVNIERLQKNATEAAEQCERLDIPTVHPLQSLSDASFEGIDLYVCWERQNATPLSQIRYTDKPTGFLIGPEGGLSQADIDCLHKFQAVSLGPLILRAETACLAALAIRSMYES